MILLDTNLHETGWARARLLNERFAATMMKDSFSELGAVMNTYETSATVEDQGRVEVVGVPLRRVPRLR